MRSRSSNPQSGLVALLLSVTLVFTGCMDADPFGLAYRRIAGEYELYESESHDYYLERDGHAVDGVGYIEGTVQELGWNEEYIFAKRFSCFRGDPDGWMIINLWTNEMQGPLADEEFRSRFPAALTYPVREAWERL